MARVAIVQLGESLPRGNHQARMLALDDAGQTLAVLPIIVRGTNTAATSQVDGNVQMQRAVTVLVGNVEAICTTMQSHLDLVSKGYQESLSQTMLLTDTLQGLVAAKSEQTALAEERLARSRRMDLLFEKFMPMLELGFGIVAAEVERRYSDRNKLKPPAAPPPPAPSPPAAPAAPVGTKDLTLCVFSAPSIDDVRELLNRTGNDHWEEIPFWVDLARRRHMIRADMCEAAVSDIRRFLNLTPPVPGSEVVDKGGSKVKGRRAPERVKKTPVTKGRR